MALLAVLLLSAFLSLSSQRVDAETIIPADTAIDTSMRWSLAVSVDKRGGEGDWTVPALVLPSLLSF